MSDFRDNYKRTHVTRAEPIPEAEVKAIQVTWAPTRVAILFRDHDYSATVREDGVIVVDEYCECCGVPGPHEPGHSDDWNVGFEQGWLAGVERGKNLK